MLLLIAAVITSAPPVVAPANPVGDMPIINPNRAAAAPCPPTSRYEAMKRGGKLLPRHLNELPPADVYSAVYRRIGGCVAPVIVRYGVGGR